MLELNRISAAYGKQTVLNDVSAFFEKGKLTSIIGVNGCGKSTLLKAILGILPLSDGEIAVDGENLLTMSRNEIAKKIAYLSQGKNTPDMTVMQMVLHGRFPYLSYPRKYTSRDREIAYSAMEHNYDKYFNKGDAERNTLTEFNSNNTRRLNLEETKAKIASLAYIQEELAKTEK